MEKDIPDFDISLLFWQVLLVALLIAAVYFPVKLYKKLMK